MRNRSDGLLIKQRQKIFRKRNEENNLIEKNVIIRPVR